LRSRRARVWELTPRKPHIKNLNPQGETMPIRRHLLLRLGAAVPILLLAVQPVVAQAESDSERLEKLERAVEQLQQRNAQLEAEITDLKKERTSTPAPPAEGPTKKQVVYDGKTYVEKNVPVEKSSGDKWKLFNALTELELYGDARLRYEYRGGRTNGSSVGTPNDWQERERERYRLRLGLRGTLLDDWFFGVRLETSTNSRSTNVTFGDESSGGPFAKDSDRISVGQAYLGYSGFRDIRLTGGRMPNPLVSTRMVWDDDINPEGLAEQWKHTFTIGGGGEPLQSYSKDGKAVASAQPSEPALKIDVFANFGQFVYDDANPENPLGPRSTTVQPGIQANQRVPNTDAFLLAWQVGAKFQFPNTLYTQVAPTLYNYTGNGDTFNVHFIGGETNVSNATSQGTNQTGINSLLVFDSPWEIGWKIDKLPMRVFGDFAVNLEGDDRAAAAFHPNKGDQRYAYQVGLAVGQLKKKRDWQIEALWQHTDQYALDPNLVDSDLFDSRVNMEGVAVDASYGLSDAVFLKLTWAYAWPSDNSLGTGGIGDIGVNPLDKYQLFQADLSVKF
jgi:Putative porin